ncbi:replication protein A 70 kDa DNA-binding subunit, partial [Trifolium pratense]
SSLSVTGNWHKLWDMQIPPKLKHFCWRLFRGCIPTRFNLHNGEVACETVCALYNETIEDELHLFIDCLHAIWLNKQANSVTTCYLVQTTLAASFMPDYETTWKKPGVTWLKCNVDGALLASEGKCGIGICFRDRSGSLVRAHTMVFPVDVTAAECEATALKYAITFAMTNGFKRVKFESDCQHVVNALINDRMYENELGTLLATCRSILSSNISYNIAFIRRQANRVAHNLARASLSQSSPIVHYYYPPNCIPSIVIEEII